MPKVNALTGLFLISVIFNNCNWKDILDHMTRKVSITVERITLYSHTWVSTTAPRVSRSLQIELCGVARLKQLERWGRDWACITDTMSVLCRIRHVGNDAKADKCNAYLSYLSQRVFSNYCIALRQEEQGFIWVRLALQADGLPQVQGGLQGLNINNARRRGSSLSLV